MDFYKKNFMMRRFWAYKSNLSIYEDDLLNKVLIDYEISKIEFSSKFYIEKPLLLKPSKYEIFYIY